MKSAPIFKYVCFMLSILIAQSNLPLNHISFAVTGQDSSITKNENLSSPDVQKSMNADAVKISEGDSIIIKEDGPQIADSLRNETHKEKRKALFGFLFMAAIGLFWAGVLLFWSAMSGDKS